jgi:hypothetical protein
MHEVLGAHTELRRAHVEAFFVGLACQTRGPCQRLRLGKRQGNPRRRSTRPTNASEMHPFSSGHVLNLSRKIEPDDGPSVPLAQLRTESSNGPPRQTRVAFLPSLAMGWFKRTSE